MRLAVVGASGRMGRAVVRLAHGRGVEVVCAVGTTDIGRDAGELAGIGPTGTCVVDGLGGDRARARRRDHRFLVARRRRSRSRPSPRAAGRRSSRGRRASETTRVTPLDRAAARVPVLWEPNMSVGVHVLA